MCGTTARQARKIPVRSMSIVCCHCSRDISINGASARIPAELTRMSMRPWAARTSCTAASTDAWACDVQGYRAGCTDGFGCLLGRLGAAVGDHDGRSLDAEGLGDRRADPSGATDDERHLAGQDWPNGAHGVLTGGIRSPCDSVRAAARWGVSPKLSGLRRDASPMTRTEVLSDEMWAQIEPVLPALKGSMGRPMRQHRPLVEGRSTATGQVSPGVICRRSSVRGRRCGSGITASPPMAPGTRF